MAHKQAQAQKLQTCKDKVSQSKALFFSAGGVYGVYFCGSAKKSQSCSKLVKVYVPAIAHCLTIWYFGAHCRCWYFGKKCLFDVTLKIMHFLLHSHTSTNITAPQPVM